MRDSLAAYQAGHRSRRLPLRRKIPFAAFPVTENEPAQIAAPAPDLARSDVTQPTRSPVFFSSLSYIGQYAGAYLVCCDGRTSYLWISMRP